MGRPLFTPEELEELKRIDAEIDETFEMTMDEFNASSALDRKARGYTKATGDDRKTYKKQYYKANREKYQARNKAFREKYPDYGQSYYAANREQLKAKSRERYHAELEKNRKRNRDYYLNHREEVLAKARERRARKKMNGGNENGTRT